MRWDFVFFSSFFSADKSSSFMSDYLRIHVDWWWINICKSFNKKMDLAILQKKDLAILQNVQPCFSCSTCCCCCRCCCYCCCKELKVKTNKSWKSFFCLSGNLSKMRSESRSSYYYLLSLHLDLLMFTLFRLDLNTRTPNSNNSLKSFLLDATFCCYCSTVQVKVIPRIESHFWETRSWKIPFKESISCFTNCHGLFEFKFVINKTTF